MPFERLTFDYKLEGVKTLTWYKDIKKRLRNKMHWWTSTNSLIAMHEQNLPSVKILLTIFILKLSFILDVFLCLETLKWFDSNNTMIWDYIFLCLNLFLKFAIFTEFTEISLLLMTWEKWQLIILYHFQAFLGLVAMYIQRCQPSRIVFQ